MRIMRKLLSLQLLKAGAIRKTYEELFSMCRNHQGMMKLKSYMDTTWMNHSVWAIKDWCVFGKVVRTNNDVEGNSIYFFYYL